MALRTSGFASLAALAAALSMAATPAAAAELPHRANGHAQVETGAPDAANQYRHYRRHRDRGIDAGDVVAGVVVLGALAAIIGSSRDHRRDRERYEQPREQGRYDGRERQDYESNGIERAVDMCIDEIERYDDRVETVDEARRAPDGWHVSGTLDNGSGWDCEIDNNGRISDVVMGGNGYVTPGDGRYYGSQAVTPRGSGQLSDSAYASARASTRTPADDGYAYRYDDTAPAPSDDARPAYPGGPLPGEEGYEADWQVDGDIDDRYGT